MFANTSKILIVDDLNVFRAMVRLALIQIHFKNLVEANDGTTGWTALKEAIQVKAPFDIIISDWNMPKMKGIELLKHVRKE